jgi:hypothetical protein
MSISKTIDFGNDHISLSESEQYRVVSIHQKHLSSDSKWGKYLTAPSTFFEILGSQSQKLCPLEKHAKVNLGIKSGANEFFCFPNKHFDSVMTKKGLKITNRGISDLKYVIPKEYIKRALRKIKKHRKINLKESDGYLLVFNKHKSEAPEDLRNYLEDGEKVSLPRSTRREQDIIGYQNISSVRSHRPYWYCLGERSEPSIIFPSISWGRFIVFHNNIKAIPTNAFFEIHPFKKKNAKILTAILNSTFTALIAEFSGRYIENRDKTISNQIMVYEVSNLPVIDLDLLSKDIKEKLEIALDKISSQELGLRSLYTENDMKVKEQLDTIIFCDIFGLPKKRMHEIRENLAETVKRRVERGKISQDDDELDE